MKWIAMTAKAENDLLQEDWNNGEKYGPLKAGKNWLFKKGALGTSYVPYKDIIWAYRQIETVDGKLCCGKASFDIHHLIIHTNGKQRLDIRLEERKPAQELLDIIAAANPDAEIGFSAEKKAKFA